MTKLLVVDDSPTVLKIMSTSLLTQGFTVKTAVNGMEAMKVAREMSPDIIVLDINLPDYSGFEVLGKLKDHPDLKDVPVLLLTGQDNLDNTQKGIELGASGFLGKYATSPKVLGNRIREILDS